MKKVAIIVSISLLFSSCYSYKPYIDSTNELTTETKYHIDLKNGKEMVTKIDSISSNAFYYTKGNQLEVIKFSEINKIEEGTFSTSKTIGFSALMTLGAAVIVGFIYIFDAAF